MPNVVGAQLPPFLFTYWNPFNKDSHLVSSWFGYIKNVSLAQYAADSVGRYIQEASVEQARTLDETGRRICGSLYAGFSNLQSGLSLISSQIGDISSTLESIDNRIALQLDEARTSNLLEENVAELLRIPDSEKQRQHRIEMGLRFLKNALRDEDLYKDALTELLESEKLMPSDYFVLHRIGMIYLYVAALGDLAKAADYFSRAGKYAAVESDPQAVRLSSILNKRVSQRFSEQGGPSMGDIGDLAAESYMQAAAAHYALSQFDDAVKMAEKAVRLRPGDAKHQFYLAKYQARVGKAASAVEHLEKAVELVPEMALATVADFDLNRSEGVLELLNRLDAQVTNALQTKIPVLQGWPQKDFKAQEVRDLLVGAEKALNGGDFVQRALALRTANSCVERLPFAGQLAELGDFGVSFNAAFAESLLRQGKREEVERLWAKRSKEFVVLNPTLAQLAAKSEHAWLELILLVTAEEEQHFRKLGSQRWEVPVTGRMSGAIGLEGTVCIAEYGGRILALDPVSGKTLWELAINASLEFVAIGLSDALFVGTSGKLDSDWQWEVFPRLYALDVRTGQKLWDYEPGSLKVHEAAIGADGTVYVGLERSSLADGSDSKQSCAVAALEGPTGTKRWSVTLPCESLDGIAIGSDGTIYVGAHGPDCRVIALDGRSGASRWDVGVKQASWVSHLGLGGDDTLYFSFSHSELDTTCEPPTARSTAQGFVAVDGRDGCEIWRYNAGSEGGGPCGLVLGTDGTIFGGCGEHIYALDAKSGKARWIADLPGNVRGIVLGLDGALYAAFSCLTEMVGQPPFKIKKVGGAAGFMSLDVRSGKKAWEFDMKNSLSFSELVSVANDGTAILRCCEDLDEGPDRLVAICTRSGGPAKSPWPMAYQNPQRTGMSLEAKAKYLAQISVSEEQERRVAEIHRQAQCAAEIKRLLETARAAEAAENSKWLRKKDYSKARELYAQAAALGSEEATAKADALPR